MKDSVLSLEEKALLIEAVNKWQPSLLPLLEILGTVPLTEDQREALRGVLADEFSATGLSETYEPNIRGFRLEELIDHLGYL